MSKALDDLFRMIFADEMKELKDTIADKDTQLADKDTQLAYKDTQIASLQAELMKYKQMASANA